MPVPSTRGLHRRSLLRDQVYLSLRDAIVTGTLAPGERLRDEELQQWLGVSRTPIREALLRLERNGLVHARPGHSTTVAPIDVPAAHHAQEVAASMHELAVRLAVPRLGAADIEAMRAANDRFARAVQAGDPDAALTADDEFHDVALVASGNPLIPTIMEEVAPLLRRIERIHFGSLAGRDSVGQHERIIALCAAGQRDEAALAVRENWHALSSVLPAG